ncbi:MAG: hypothetical protein JSU08_11150 [Acidobacteria bacterium]|nr:hypothetical protein [Acidobacteriota bacterium]
MTDTTSAGSAEQPQPARLLITRSSERDVRNRQIFVSLDGKAIGDVLFGEKIDRPISPGPHRMRIHNTLFWKTLEFDAAPGETIHYETVNYAGRGFLHIVLIIGVAPLFLAVERVRD